jgi:hypothetical protein
MGKDRKHVKVAVKISVEDFRNLLQLSDSRSLDMSLGAVMPIGRINSIRELLTKYLPDFLKLEEKS